MPFWVASRWFPDADIVGFLDVWWIVIKGWWYYRSHRRLNDPAWDEQKRAAEEDIEAASTANVAVLSRTEWIMCRRASYRASYLIVTSELRPPLIHLPYSTWSWSWTHIGIATSSAFLCSWFHLGHVIGLRDSLRSHLLSQPFCWYYYLHHLG